MSSGNVRSMDSIAVRTELFEVGIPVVDGQAQAVPGYGGNIQVR